MGPYRPVDAVTKVLKDHPYHGKISQEKARNLGIEDELEYEVRLRRMYFIPTQFNLQLWENKKDSQKTDIFFCDFTGNTEIEMVNEDGTITKQKVNGFVIEGNVNNIIRQWYGNSQM